MGLPDAPRYGSTVNSNKIKWRAIYATRLAEFTSAQSQMRERPAALAFEKEGRDKSTSVVTESSDA
jgi:hypothetical protein